MVTLESETISNHWTAYRYRGHPVVWRNPEHFEQVRCNLLPSNNFLAEAQGFEPWKPLGLLVFKTSAIDHSAKLPFLMNRI